MSTVIVKRDESLRNLMKSFEADPSPQNRLAVYAVFPQAMVYVGTPMVPEEWLKAAAGTSKAHRLPLLTAMGRDNSRAIVAFCDEASVKQAGADLFAVCLKATELLKLVLAQDVDALMLKNGDFWMGIPREDLQKLSPA